MSLESPTTDHMPSAAPTGFVPDAAPASLSPEAGLGWRQRIMRGAARTALAVSTLTGVTAGAEMLTAAPAHADTIWSQHVYNTGSYLWLHPNSSTIHSSVSDQMPDGTTFDITCWQYGDAVEGDSIWDFGTDTATGHTGYAADKYIDTPVTEGNEASQLLTLGLPECGSQEVTAPSSAIPLQGGSGIPLQGDISAVPLGTNIYNRQAAVGWAIANAEDQPPASASCAWFASNVLWQGSLAKTSEWTSAGWLGGELHADYQAYVERVQPLPGTQDAWNAPDLKDYLQRTYPHSAWEPIDFSPNNNDPSDAQPGDLVFYDWGQGEGVSHVAVVTKVEPSGYLDVSDWSTNPTDGTLPSPVVMRGVTYSAVNHEWLQQEFPNVSAHLMHIDTTGSPGNP